MSNRVNMPMRRRRNRNRKNNRGRRAFGTSNARSLDTITSLRQSPSQNFYTTWLNMAMIKLTSDASGIISTYRVTDSFTPVNTGLFLAFREWRILEVKAEIVPLDKGDGRLAVFWGTDTFPVLDPANYEEQFYKLVPNDSGSTGGRRYFANWKASDTVSLDFIPTYAIPTFGTIYFRTDSTLGTDATVKSFNIKIRYLVQFRQLGVDATLAMKTTDAILERKRLHEEAKSLRKRAHDNDDTNDRLEIYSMLTEKSKKKS